MVFEHSQQIRGLIGMVIEDGGSLFALRIVYRDAKGVRKRRHISPMSWCATPTRFWVLCLATGLVKKLLVGRVESAEPVPAWELLIPVESVVLESFSKVQ